MQKRKMSQSSTGTKKQIKKKVTISTPVVNNKASDFPGLKNFSTENITEDMKNTDMLYWVGMMNNFKNEAEEIVFKELIYV